MAKFANPGRYANASDLMRDIIRERQEKSAAVARLQAEIDRGRASGISDKSVDEVFAEAREKAIAALKARDAAAQDISGGAAGHRRDLPLWHPTCGPEQADGYINWLRSAVLLIAQHPLMGRERNEVRPPIRLWRHEAHHLFYDLIDGTVVLQRVPHYSADWTELF